MGNRITYIMRNEANSSTMQKHGTFCFHAFRGALYGCSFKKPPLVTSLATKKPCRSVYLNGRERESMKLKVDEDTGELVEVPETNDLVASELLAVGVNMEAYFEQKLKANALKEQMEMWEFENREKIINVFKKYGIKSFKNDSGSVSYVPEGLSQRVDVDQLKADGLYDKYSKWVPSKEHLVIKVKEK